MEIITVGGYSEVGKNMTALRIGDEVIIIDMGFYLPKLIDFEEEGGDRKNLTRDGLIKLGAVPDDNVISDYANNVRAIVLGHCHLDHIGAVPYLAGKYNAPIYGSPYTIEVLQRMMNDDRIRINNKIKALNLNSSFKISNNLTIELINMTHSTLQTAMVAVHTKKGTILYANDFKFDNHPILGKKPNYKRLKELGQENVIALIVDSLYAAEERKTPSEKVAREMLKDVMLGTDNENNAVIATTFASHIARLESILSFGEKMNRNVIFLGRSMAKYIGAAEKLNLVNFSKRAEIVGFGGQVKRKLKQIEKEGKSNYLIICTGNQGEPGSVLNRIATNQFQFELTQDDHVIFSCRTIPSPVNQANRAMLESKLKRKKTRIFTQIHTSGHAGREDLRDLIHMVKPKHIIPAHGEMSMLTALGELAQEMGYIVGKNVHISSDGQTIRV